MDKLDNKIKDILNKTKKPASGEKKVNCPEDTVLAQFIDDALNDSDKQKMEQHLSECNYCLDQIILHKKILEEEALEGLPDVPPALVHRAMDLVTENKKDVTTGIVDVILKFAMETIEIINNPGNLSISYGAMPVPVRGEQQTLNTNFVTMHKTFSDIVTEIEIENVGEGKANISVMAKGVKPDATAGRFRISLFNPHREIASYVSEDGRAHFENLKYGEYVVKIIRQGENIGQIGLVVS